MVTKYPSQIDTSITLPTAVDNLTPVQGSIFNRLRDTVISIEQELGVKPSGSYSTVRARIDSLENIVGNLQIIELNKDLGGTLEQPKVIGIQGNPISDVEPNFGEVLTWSGIAWIPAAQSGGEEGSPSGSAGGDLAGSYPSPTVHDLTISGESQGDILYRNATNWVRLAAGTDGYTLTTHSTGADPTWELNSGTSSPTEDSCGIVTPPINSAGAPTFTLSDTSGLFASATTTTGLVYTGSSLFSLENPSGPSCRLVYTGPDCIAIITCCASIRITLFEVGSTVLAIELNSDLVNQDIANGRVLGAQYINVNDSDVNQLTYITRRRVNLTSGSKFGAVFGVTNQPGQHASANGFTLDVQIEQVIVGPPGPTGPQGPSGGGGGSACGIMTVPAGQSVLFHNSFEQLSAPTISVGGMTYTGTSLFVLADPGGPSCKLKFTGTTCQALVRVIASIPQLANTRTFLAVSYNDDLEGAAPNAGYSLGAQCADGNVNSPPLPMTTERLLSLSTNDVINPVMALDSDDDPGFPITNYGLSMSVMVVEIT